MEETDDLVDLPDPLDDVSLSLSLSLYFYYLNDQFPMQTAPLWKQFFRIQQNRFAHLYDEPNRARHVVIGEK